MSEIRRRAGGKSGRSLSYINEDDEKHIHHRMESLNLSPSKYLVILYLAVFSFILLGVYFNDYLPSQEKNISDFNVPNAVENLGGLVKIGSKVTGSYENEVEAVNYITGLIYDIMKKTSPKHNISYDLQKVSGNFSLSFLSKRVNLVYANVQNIVVKIGPKPFSDKSLLLNCHFDSVPVSPGASDDGLNCAVMIEILRVVATSDKDLPHNIIFLFNGAEENPLLASHGFITQHRWAKDVKAFINLESCGAGGREVLFQAGPNHPWLIDAYSKAAKHPSGFVIAEEMFQNGLIPSDTDFRIFRDYGKIPGLDFAHCRNGFVYHTRSDNLESIHNIRGVAKHTGDNILSLAKHIIQSEDFMNIDKKKSGNTVYFDLFGFLFVNYSAETAKILNASTVILAVAGIIISIHYQPSNRSLKSSFLYSFVIMIANVFLSIAYNLALAFSLDFFGFSMSWYSNSIYILPLYTLPVIIIMAVNILLFDEYQKRKSNINLKIKTHYLGILLFWTSLLLLTTFTNVRSSFLLTLVVLPPAIYTLFSSFVQHLSSSMYWFIIYLVVTIPVSLYLAYLGISAIRVFIPITGRSGGEKNPEFIISLLVTLLSTLILSYYPTLILAVKKRWIAVNILVISHVMFLIYIITLPSGFPFTISAPQRVLVTHVNRQFFDAEKSLKRSDSLFWVQNMDRRGRNVLSLLKDAPLLEEFCKKDGYCGLPWYSKLQEKSSSSCISSAPHDIADETNLDLVSKTQISKNVIRFEFNISGPDHMGLIIKPLEKVSLTAWNLPGKIEKKPSYFVSFVYGLYQPSWTLWFDVMFDESINHKSYFEIELYGLYIHHDKHFSQSYTSFINQFPQWSHVTPSLAMYKSFQY